MLNAMLTVFLLGGGLLGGAMLTPSDTYPIADRLEAAIKDPQQLSQVKQILSELETEVTKFERIFVDSGNGLRDLYLDHDAGSRQTQRRLEELNLEWYVSQQRNIKLRELLRLSIDAEQWDRVFDHE